MFPGDCPPDRFLKTYRFAITEFAADAVRGCDYMLGRVARKPQMLRSAFLGQGHKFGGPLDDLRDLRLPGEFGNGWLFTDVINSSSGVL